MIIFGTFLLIYLASLVLAIITKRNYKRYLDWCWKDTHILISVICFFVVLFMFFFIPKKRDVEYEIAKYENLKEQSESLTREDIVDLDKLREEILEMNNTIDRNKIYSSSPWISIWYKKEIGNLQKLTYTGRK